MSEKSKSEKHLGSTQNIILSALEYDEDTNKKTPLITTSITKNVSDYRKSTLEQEVNQGLFRDGSSSGEYKQTSNAVVASSVGFKKNAQVTSSTDYRGGVGDTVKQAPEVYSPLWLNSNLNLPKDRATVNAWCRSFFALNPFVHNAIGLHSTYPISKMNIKCANKEVEKFFNEMIEEIDLMNICVQIAQEYWLLGEAFIYAELDESKGKWSRLLIQNPDYMIVQRTVVANEPIIMLRPDENLKKIVHSNRPADLEQKKQLNKRILDCVKRGENIPIDNFHISHLARRISPYEIRGTGLPVCIFRQLMLFDKLRECYSDDTEVLTNKGFKKINDLVYKTTNIELNPNYVNGVEIDENGIKSILTMKEDFEVACVNENNEIEYHKPIELHMSQYKGEMIHFSGKKVDCLVTPNHKMWAKERINGNWREYTKIQASDLLEKNKHWKFKSQVKYNLGNDAKSVFIGDKEIPIELYLKALGYIISEGCVYENFKNGRYDAKLYLSQLTSSDCYEDMRQTFDIFADKLNKNILHTTRVDGAGYSANTPKEKWEARIHGKDLTQYLKKEIGVNNSAASKDKHIPRWILDLKPELLKIILNSLMLGDGSESVSKYGTGSMSYRYSTISKQLADDVYEIVYKLGYVPNICVSTASKSDDRIVQEYIVLWSDTNYGNEPLVYVGEEGGGATTRKVNYDGVVWCFEVPTGLFITRRNGKITVQGNSKFAQADNMVNPLTLVKIGSADFKPTFADLDAWRSIFECHDEDTEVLTNQGFKKFNEVIDYEDCNDIKINCKPKENIKIACFNAENENLEYHQALNASLYNYDGDMYHFSNKKIDIKVTPNHKMFVSKRNYKSKYENWHKEDAKDLVTNNYYKFRSCVNWVGAEVDYVDVCDKTIPINNYLEYLGYLLSEGSVYNIKSNRHYYVSICQSTITDKKHQPEMSECFNEFANNLGLNNLSDVSKNGMWSGSLRNKEIYDYFKKEIGTNGDTKSQFKHVPKWVLSLSPRLLNILLTALVKGDGSVYETRVNKYKYISYTTTSKRLADDVYEIAFKCGYSPLLTPYKERENRLQAYTISWSEDKKGKGYYPLLHKGNSKKETNPLTIERYIGKVWCFEVPTGLFITRRNGKITIQGNSAQYDKDFKIFTHEGVDVTRVGAGQGIYDISGDITQIIKEIYIGLQVPSVLMDGGSDTTYANGGVALDVLRQRYMQFRNMMGMWLKRKIFAPISKINNFYDLVDGQKQLIVPEVDWNHMSLFDAGDYINILVQLTQGTDDQKRASVHTLYRSLGLDYKDETLKKRQESIQNVIEKKEKAALEAMTLNELRAIDDDHEISEPEGKEGQAPAPVPGEAPPGGGLPGLDMGLPPMPGSGGEAPPPPPPSGGGGEAPPPPM